MESRIPLPTDNIYKFYALFGLLLFVFSIGSSVYNARTANETVFQTIIENAAIPETTNPSPEVLAKKKVLERRYEIAVQDRQFFDKALGVLAGFGLVIMAFGFSMWHWKVQPDQDKMMRLQLEKLQYEVDHLPKAASPSVAVETPQKQALEAED
jgi:hypothetical protein